jgi:hypothetical protein
VNIAFNTFTNKYFEFTHLNPLQYFLQEQSQSMREQL